MGILNLTPDSFYDGNIHISKEFINSKIKSYKNADIIDIGAESSRPYSKKISIIEEIKRLDVFIENNPKSNRLLSIDSYKYEVIKYALENNFNIINDISGGGENNKNIALASDFNVPIIIMHMQGIPETMQINPKYNNIVDDIIDYFEKKIYIMKNEFNLSDNQIILDPGIGFGKTIADNYKLINNISRFKKIGFPLLIGLSRKSFLSLGNDSPKDRLAQSLILQSISLYNGADCIRTHDVEETYKFLEINNKLKLRDNKS